MGGRGIAGRPLRREPDEGPDTPTEQDRAQAEPRDEEPVSREAIDAEWDRIDQAEHDEWQATHGPDTPHEAQLRTVMSDLTTQAEKIEGPGSHWMDLNELRTALPHLSRAEFDTAFRGLISDPDMNVAPEAYQSRLTPADRAARLHLGGDRHIDIVHLRTRTTGSDKGAQP